MISTTREERHWLLRNLAQGLFQHLGVAVPPVPVEELHKHPPQAFEIDFGVVDMFKCLWDATFARPPSGQGSIFVRFDLSPEERRAALARETLHALVSSRHGRSMGLGEMLGDSLRESSEYFAGHLTAPEVLVTAYRKRTADHADGFADSFGIPAPIASARWAESAEHIQ